MCIKQKECYKVTRIRVDNVFCALIFDNVSYHPNRIIREDPTLIKKGVNFFDNFDHKNSGQ
jgi:hypothetical protein